MRRRFLRVPSRLQSIDRKLRDLQLTAHQKSRQYILFRRSNSDVSFRNGMKGSPCCRIGAAAVHVSFQDHIYRSGTTNPGMRGPCIPSTMLIDLTKSQSIPPPEKEEAWVGVNDSVFSPTHSQPSYEGYGDSLCASTAHVRFPPGIPVHTSLHISVICLIQSAISPIHPSVSSKKERRAKNWLV